MHSKNFSSPQTALPVTAVIDYNALLTLFFKLFLDGSSVRLLIDQLWFSLYEGQEWCLLFLWTFCFEGAGSHLSQPPGTDPTQRLTVASAKREELGGPGATPLGLPENALFPKRNQPAVHLLKLWITPQAWRIIQINQTQKSRLSSAMPL